MKKLTKLDLIQIALVCAVGLLAFFFINRFNSSTSPVFNLDFKIDKEESLNQAGSYLKNAGVKIDEYKSASIFKTDENASLYLDKELGAEEAAKIGQSKKVWYWNNRFFQDNKVEEFLVGYDIGGSLSYLNHKIEEDKPMEKISTEEAKKIAEKFLAEQKVDLNNFSLVGNEIKNQKNREDHRFIWEEKNFKAKEATYQIELLVQGREIGFYNNYLKVPENWLRDYAKTRAKNDTAQEVSNFFYIGLAIAATIIFLFNFKKFNFSKRFVWLLMLVILLAAIINQLNTLPLIKFDLENNISVVSVVIMAIIGTILMSSINLLMLSSSAVAGEQYNREMKNNNQTLLSVKKNFWSKKMMKSLIIGVSFAFVFMALQCVYYMIGRKLGYWSPASVNYSDIFSTIFPWAMGLFVGLSAAFTEEILIRYFGINFLKKIVKFLPLAVIITSAIWGFGHSNYPQMPWYARGVELTLLGCIWAFVYLRFGIWAAIASHFTVDAFITASFMNSSGNLYNIITSYLIAFIPLIMAGVILVRYLIKKEFATDESEHERDQQVKNDTPISNKVIENKKPIQLHSKEFQLPSKKAWLALIFVAIFSIFIGVYSFSQTGDKSAYTPDPQYEIDRQTALEIAQKYLSGENIETNQYKTVVFQDTTGNLSYDKAAAEKQNGSAEGYLSTNGSSANQSLEFIDKNTFTGGFTVRFYTPENKDEYQIVIGKDGQIEAINHLLDEEAIGQTLSKEDALKIAENYLVNSKKISLEDLRTIESKKIDRKHRIDYIFVWESTIAKIADATVRYELRVLGNEPSNFARYIMVPESYINNQKQISARQAIGFLSFFIALAGLIYAITYFFNLHRQNLVDWKLSKRIGLAGTIIFVATYANNIPRFYANYTTYTPLNLWHLQFCFSLLLLIALVWLSITFFSAFSLAIIKSGGIRFKLPENRFYWLKTICLTLLLSTLLLPFGYIFELISGYFQIPKTITSITNPQYLDTYLPVIGQINIGFFIAITILVSLAIMIAVRRLFKNNLLFISAIILTGLLSSLAIPSTKDVIVAGIMIVISVLFGYAAFKFWIKNNLGIFMLLLIMLIILSLSIYTEQNIVRYKLNGLIPQLILVAMSLLYLVIFTFRKKR